MRGAGSQSIVIVLQGISSGILARVFREISFSRVPQIYQALAAQPRHLLAAFYLKKKYSERIVAPETSITYLSDTKMLDFLTRELIMFDTLQIVLLIFRSKFALKYECALSKRR
jgi:hypothetical protein